MEIELADGVKPPPGFRIKKLAKPKIGDMVLLNSGMVEFASAVRSPGPMVIVESNYSWVPADAEAVQRAIGGEEVIVDLDGTAIRLLVGGHWAGKVDKPVIRCALRNLENGNVETSYDIDRLWVQTQATVYRVPNGARIRSDDWLYRNGVWDVVTNNHPLLDCECTSDRVVVRECRKFHTGNQMLLSGMCRGYDKILLRGTDRLVRRETLEETTLSEERPDRIGRPVCDELKSIFHVFREA